jgi:hypothetical protein
MLSCLLMLSSGVAAKDSDDESAELLNELFLSEGAAVQEAGEWQITLSPGYEKSLTYSRIEVVLELEYGITDQLQIGLEYLPYIRFDPAAGRRESGDGNIEIGLQYGWQDVGESGLDVAIAWSHEFAQGNAAAIGEPGEPAEDEDEIFIVIDAPIEAIENARAFVQIGSELTDDENETFINAGLYLRLGTTVLSAEFNWQDDQSFITPGVTRVLNNGVEVGVGLPVGIDGETDWMLVSNIVFEWE